MSRDSRFDSLNFDNFRKLASNPLLSESEKIGFPNNFREGFTEKIFEDISLKATNLLSPDVSILDIGAGLGPLPNKILTNAELLRQNVTFIDSEEMLQNIEDHKCLKKVAGKFPEIEVLESLSGTFDVIICYSVFQYAFAEVPFGKFVDSAISLLSPSGQLLIGDLPNQNMRNRFLSSESGKKYHAEYIGDGKTPELQVFNSGLSQIDDSTIYSLLSRTRLAGYHSYVLPQRQELPFANRREDVLIVKP